ncbi:siderophore-iron reductase FhuF [Rossellomorea sp. SC111]|uniref:siderophore-iron reductase FhuF n=1 Tax=Rossellomorea sp. SC111 TaxID=2968985 RepID=UPI00215A84CD|nr:siderophore-iron reductase FhuF [Rossellomorea sp. SC111]MCR8847681.1 siderophore-iron reductase FhuF [Rossellomorea sp. SC111]
MNTLNAQQWEFLRKYRFHASTQALNGEEATSFLDGGKMKAYLSHQCSQIGTDDLKVAASLFMKRYAFVAAMGLMTMTYWNKKLNLKPENLIMVNGDKNGLWMPQFHLKDASVAEFTSQEEKVSFIQSIFRDHLDHVIQSIKNATKLSNLILWENIAVYVFWIFENDDFLLDEGMKRQRNDQFQALLSDENSHWFGNYHRNPLARYYSRKVNVEELTETVRVRKTCCFSYRLGNGEQYRCKTCPQTCLVKKN